MNEKFIVQKLINPNLYQIKLLYFQYSIILDVIYKLAPNKKYIHFFIFNKKYYFFISSYVVDYIFNYYFSQLNIFYISLYFI